MLADQLGDIELTPAQREAAEAKFKQKIGPDYGTWDATAAAWIASDEAAVDALWSADGTREILVGARAAAARGEVLTAHEKGERAQRIYPWSPVQTRFQ